MSRRRLLAVSLALLAVPSGCTVGSTPGDLLAVERSGDVPGAELRVVIGDSGMAQCNDGEAIRLPEDLLLEARDVERELEEEAAAGVELEPGPRSILRYAVSTPTGDLRFADTSRGRVEAMDQLAYLVRRVAQDVCGLER